MRTGFLLLLLAPALGGQTSLALLTDFEGPSSARVVTVMHDELTRIMKPLGWNLEWHALANRPAVLPRFVILSFRGVCRMETGFLENPESPTLATTQTSEGHVLPFSTVECNKIRSQLAHHSGIRDADAILGRAMGRIVAHELYHFLLQTRDHTKQGIAIAVQTARELTAADFRFDELSSIRLRISSGTEPTILKDQAQAELQSPGSQPQPVERAGILPEVCGIHVGDGRTEVGRVGQVIPFRPELQLGLFRYHE